MSEPKWTPGGWALESARAGDEVKNPQYAVRIYSRDPGPEAASTIGFAYDPDGPTRRAHAKLWAAAPDLYKALDSIVSLWTLQASNELVSRMIAERAIAPAMEALARARGEA
jgi:hypothetical protein